MSNGGEDDDTHKSLEESIPESEVLKDISGALYDDVKAEYVNELDDEAHEVLHAAIHYISVFHQLVRRREDSGGVRGRREIEEMKELVEDKIENGMHPTDLDLVQVKEVLEWVLGVRDDL